VFGERLKELRKSKKVTQEDLAKKFDVNPATVSAWEVGKAEPSYEVLTELANYFGVSIDYLLNFTQDDLDKIEKLKQALKEAGMWDYEMDDMSKEDFEKAMKIVAMMKKQ
jgi:transcriptional regulator with XRE-family HTH domain